MRDKDIFRDQTHSGIAYCVGVGPGDPELMTLKAVRVIRDSDVIALPGKDPRQTAAYRIALRAVPETEEKELLAMDMPMTMDKRIMDEAHRKNAELLERYLSGGKSVVCLTLGDPAVYSTFTYIRKILEEDGYETDTVSGVPSFCAAAGTLNIPLAEWNEQMHIIPASHVDSIDLRQPGTYVLMKTGSRMGEIKQILAGSGKDVYMVENCGMEDEKLYRNVEEIPEDAGYFSLIIVKNPRT